MNWKVCTVISVSAGATELTGSMILGIASGIVMAVMLKK